DGDRARVVRHDEGATGGRDVLDAPHLDPEPVPVDRAEHGIEHVLGEVDVVAEVVDLVVAVDPAPHVGEHLGDAALDVLGGDAGGLGAEAEHADDRVQGVADVGQRQAGAARGLVNRGVERRLGGGPGGAVGGAGGPSPGAGPPAAP